jgi:hypothetical protein
VPNDIRQAAALGGFSGGFGFGMADVKLNEVRTH